MRRREQIVDARDDRSCYTAASPCDAEALRLVLERHGAARFLFAEAPSSSMTLALLTCTTSEDCVAERDRVARVTEHPFWVCERGILAAVALDRSATHARRVAELARCSATVRSCSPSGQALPESHALIVRAAGTTKGTAVSGSRAPRCTPRTWCGRRMAQRHPQFQRGVAASSWRPAPEAVKVHAPDRLEGTLGAAWPRPSRAPGRAERRAVADAAGGGRRGMVRCDAAPDRHNGAVLWSRAPATRARPFVERVVLPRGTRARS